MGELTKCPKYNLYIIYTILTLLFNKCLYGLNYNDSFWEVKIASDGFSTHICIHKFFSYFGTFFLSLVFNKIKVNNSRSESLIEIPKEENRHGNEIRLIYIDSQSDINKYKTPKFLFYYLCIIFIWIIEEQFIESFHLIFKDLDFWMIELLIICYLNSRIFKVEIYNHQKLAIILSIFSSLLKIVTIILSFLKNEEEYDDGHLPIFYKNGSAYKIPFGIFFYLVLISLRSYVNLTLKWYMDKKFISHTKILMVYGLIGTVLYLIICIITTFIKCKVYNGDNDHDIDFFDYICKVKDIEGNNITLYLENLNIFFDDFLCINVEILRGIIVIILGIVSFFMSKYFTILVIKCLSPVYVIFSFPILFILEKIVLIIYTFIRDNLFFKTKSAINHYKFVLDIIGDIVSLLGFLIYLEIITLNCETFNYNLKNSIIVRGGNEASDINENDNSFSSSNDNISEVEEGNNILEESGNE